jgi:uncharacterized protein with HEPN domain
LEDILENIARIERYAGGCDLETFAADQQRQDAIERCLMRISEAARKLGALAESLVPGQPWSDIRDVGSVLRHDYDRIAPAIIWKVVMDDLPALRSAIEAALRRAHGDT